MSKQALYDAFMAGWLERGSFGEGEPWTDDGQKEFDRWYARAVTAGSRESKLGNLHAVTYKGHDFVVEYERQRDIATEGQRAAIYHGGEARKRRRKAGDT